RALAPSAAYSLSLHDALPILRPVGRTCATLGGGQAPSPRGRRRNGTGQRGLRPLSPVHRGRGAQGAGTGTRLTSQISSAYCRVVDRKSTRLNSSHLGISYAVF